MTVDNIEEIKTTLAAICPASPVGGRQLLRGGAVRPDDGRTGDLDPRGAVTLFEAGLNVYWEFVNGQPPYRTTDDQPQEVKLDLANDKLGFMIQCPTVELGILAPRTQHGPPFGPA